MWQEIIEGLQQRARENVENDPRDYTENGLLHCWKCHKPKEIIVQFPWGEQKCVAQCDCQLEEQRKQEEARKVRQRAEKVERLRERGFHDQTLRSWTFAADDGSSPVLMKKMRSYVSKFPIMRDENCGLLLYGTVGTGKTFAAACVANALIDRNVPVIMTSFPRIINSLQATFENKQRYLDDLNDCDLLVIDDFAVERQTEYVQQIIYEVIDSRYKVGYPLIVTTNLTAKELKNPGDVSRSRIYSRLLEMCHPVEVTGPDRRRSAIIHNFSKMEAILNGDDTGEADETKA